MRPIVFALNSAFLLSAPAGAAVNDFRLPSPLETEQPSDRQGPVAPDVPESQRGPAPAPTAVETAPADVPTIVPPAALLPPTSTPTPDISPPAADASPTPDAAVLEPAPTPTGAAEIAETGEFNSPPEQLKPLSAAPDPLATGEGASVPGGWPVSWLLGAAAILAGVVAAGIAWRRRRMGAAIETREIERPQVTPSPPPSRDPALVPAHRTPEESVQMTLEPTRMSLTLMNAALAYRLQVTNQGSTALTELMVHADMIGAHASMTKEEHLAGPSNGAAMQKIDRLEPGESRVIEGEFRVPFAQIVPIRQGNAALLLPLARFKLESENAPPVVRTFAVGQPGNGALQPFRLDQGPRIYPDLAQRAFA